MDDLKMDVEAIWTRLSDEKSKELFLYRLMYYMTSENCFIQKLALTVPEVKDIYNFLKISKKRKLIFGAGTWGKEIIRTFNDVDFKYFVDNYQRGSSGGVKIIPFDEYITNYKEDLIVISSRIYNRQISNQLMEKGVKEENIVNLGAVNDCMASRQYFDLPQLKGKRCEKEIFVDGGSYDGKSSVGFRDWSRNSYNKIIAFEPDFYNINMCERTFQENGIKNYEIISKGLWSESAVLQFNENRNGSSRLVASGGNCEVSVDSLDNMIHDDVTFIKMDIEGSEYQALLGAKQIIKEKVPKLAISVYHNPEDIVQIPRLILSLRKEYKFYIRHYSSTGFDTILYAV